MVFPLIATFLVQLVVGLAIAAVGYLLMPKPKAEQPPEIKDLEDPTAEAGRPIPVVFGELDVTGVNIIWFGQKATQPRKIPA